MTSEIDPRRDAWAGYTLEQMRMARALNSVRAELVQHKIKAITEPYEKPARIARTISGKLLGALSMVDYAILAFKLVRAARRWMGKKR